MSSKGPSGSIDCGAGASGGAAAAVRHSALVITVIEAIGLTNTQMVTAQVSKSTSTTRVLAVYLVPPPLSRRSPSRAHSRARTHVLFTCD